MLLQKQRLHLEASIPVTFPGAKLPPGILNNVAKGPLKPGEGLIGDGVDILRVLLRGAKGQGAVGAHARRGEIKKARTAKIRCLR